jgi:hypothetical protein
MKNQTRFLWMVLGAAVIVLACTFSSTPTPALPATDNAVPAPAGTPERLPFEGMWVSEGDAPAIIVFTKDSMYWVESDQVSQDQVGARERFAKVVSYDLENNHITLLTQWIRVSGLMVGFDAPNFNITYQIDSETLRVGIGWGEEFAAEADPLVYYRK